MQDKRSTEQRSTEKSTPAHSLDAAAATYRRLAGSFLAASQRLAKNFPSAHKITEHSHSQLLSTWKDDPRAFIETTAGLLVRKARLHVTAALRANQTSNMHSLAAPDATGFGVRRADRHNDAGSFRWEHEEPIGGETASGSRLFQHDEASFTRPTGSPRTLGRHREHTLGKQRNRRNQEKLQPARNSQGSRIWRRMVRSP